MKPAHVDYWASVPQLWRCPPAAVKVLHAITKAQHSPINKQFICLFGPSWAPPRERGNNVPSLSCVRRCQRTVANSKPQGQQQLAHPWAHPNTLYPEQMKVVTAEGNVSAVTLLPYMVWNQPHVQRMVLPYPWGWPFIRNISVLAVKCKCKT